METNHTAEWTKSNRIFWSTARRCGLSHEDVEATIAMSYKGRVSTTELQPHEIDVLTRAMNERLMPKEEREKERWRRLLMNAVREWCKASGYRTDFVYVRNIAERGEKSLSRMSVNKLRARYNAFLQMRHELESKGGQTAVKQQSITNQ